MPKIKTTNPLINDFTIVNEVIELVLQNEKWFGDGRPRWLVGEGKASERPSQTAADASDQRIKAETRLYNNARISHAIQSLDSCCPGNRCGIGACPECTRAVQRWFVENVHNAAATILDSKCELILLSIVPDYAVTDPMKPNLNWERVVKRLCEELASVGIPWAVGDQISALTSTTLLAEIRCFKVNSGNYVLDLAKWKPYISRVPKTLARPFAIHLNSGLNDIRSIATSALS